MRLPHSTWLISLAFVSLVSGGCNWPDSGPGQAVAGLFGGPRVNVPSGTLLSVRLDQTLSSEHAKRGDLWQGVLNQPLIVEGREVIPGGATVSGVVVEAEEARRGSRARLELGLRAVRVGERKTALKASAEPLIAGSPRARNLGAIAGGAAAGALLGEATGGHAGTGAILGGAVATGAVAASKGYQVVVQDGAVMTFVIDEDVAVRVG